MLISRKTSLLKWENYFRLLVPTFQVGVNKSQVNKMHCSTSKSGKKHAGCSLKTEFYAELWCKSREPSVHKTLNFCGKKKSPLRLSEGHSTWCVRVTDHDSCKDCNLLRDMVRVVFLPLLLTGFKTTVLKGSQENCIWHSMLKISINPPVQSTYVCARLATSHPAAEEHPRELPVNENTLELALMCWDFWVPCLLPWDHASVCALTTEVLASSDF